MISLLCPFGSHDEARVRIFYWCMDRWSDMFHDGMELCIGLDGPVDGTDHFNRSVARNDAFKQSRGEILVLTDADTACNKAQVLEAIEAVRSGVPWVIAHDRYYSLNREFTNRLLDNDKDLISPNGDLNPPYESDWVMRNRSIAGVLVMHREAWEAVGGYNEAFQGWGYEDNDFAVRLDRHWGEHERVVGPMLHLWHPRGDADFSQPNIEHNEELYQRSVRGEI